LGGHAHQCQADSLSLQFYTRHQVLVGTYVLYPALSTVTTLFPVNPNPFEEGTKVLFSLPSAATVQLQMLNAMGQKVTHLFTSTMMVPPPPGSIGSRGRAMPWHQGPITYNCWEPASHR
jgi:hypothetical protein